MHVAWRFVWAVILLRHCFGIEIDNRLTDVPEVECTENEIVFRANTENPFSGRLYIKGESGDPECVRNYLTRPTTTPATMVGNNQCNVRRLRIPGESIEYVTTVVISFHPTFITKVDRAYRVHCFFRQLTDTFTVPIDVSMIATTEVLTQTSAPFVCTYEIVRGEPAGPPVRFAVIGEPVYHVWKCDTETMRILVRNCFVSDGQGNSYMVIDENGCSLDKYIVPSPEYEGPIFNMAYAESHVFKFADLPTLQFQCQIHLCSPVDEDCQQLTPPSCVEPTGFLSSGVAIASPNGTVPQTEAATVSATSPETEIRPVTIESTTAAVNATSETFQNITDLLAARLRRSFEAGGYDWDLLSNQFTILEIQDIDTSEMKQPEEESHILGADYILNDLQYEMKSGVVCFASDFFISLVIIVTLLFLLLCGLGVFAFLRSKRFSDIRSNGHAFFEQFGR